MAGQLSASLMIDVVGAGDLGIVEPVALVLVGGDVAVGQVEVEQAVVVQIDELGAPAPAAQFDLHRVGQVHVAAGCRRCSLASASTGCCPAPACPARKCWIRRRTTGRCCSRRRTRRSCRFARMVLHADAPCRSLQTFCPRDWRIFPIRRSRWPGTGRDSPSRTARRRPTASVQRLLVMPISFGHVGERAVAVVVQQVLAAAVGRDTRSCRA